MGWSPHIHTEFHVLRTTLDTTSLSSPFVYLAITVYGMLFQNISTRITYNTLWSEPRMYYYFRFGLFLFRSPLLQESISLSLPMGTKMFQFPTFPLTILLYSYGSNRAIYLYWVSSFGHLRIEAYLQLPKAYRSLLRPSSASGAKAFTLRS